MTPSLTTRQRLAALLEREPNLTRGELAGRLGVTPERISQLLGRRPPPRERAPSPALHLEDAVLLEAVITSSGLSVRKFAREVLARDERTARRWLAGALPIPAVVRTRLEAWYVDPPTRWIL